ncbi:MAG: fasciclin domain-containing protein [Methanoregula sp.]|nr:fasciclin domain-containing protein [Methanoregula sp.]
MKKLFVILMILFVGILIAGCTTKPAAPVATPAPTAVPTPVSSPEVRGCYAIIADDPQFSVLATAIKAAKLDAALNGPGPETIFAPTDAAFNSLPEGTVATLLKEPEGQLKQILLNHVVDGTALMAVEVTKLGEAKTMQGTVLKVNTTDGVTIGGARQGHGSCRYKSDLVYGCCRIQIQCRYSGQRCQYHGRYHHPNDNSQLHLHKSRHIPHVGNDLSTVP